MIQSLKARIRDSSLIYVPYYEFVEFSRKRKLRKAQEKGTLIGLISKDYKKYTHHDLRVPPISYTEKMQFAKIYAATEEKGRLTDKVEVRKWVQSKLGKDISIPLIGVWDQFDDIPWEKLPQKFVLKTNNGSGTNIIVKDKNTVDIKKIKKRINNWMKHDFSFIGKGYELHYSYIKPRLLVEEFTNDHNGELKDYKFLCFDGEPYFCWVDVDRQTNHKRNIYNMEWELQPWNQFSYGCSNKELSKPECFDEMKKIAKVLCQGFSHVRVDLYDVDNKVYFGEMTFTNGKGYELIVPEQANEMLGSLWHLENEIGFLSNLDKDR